MATSEIKLSLKVLVDSDKKKVLFAEADSDFVDVLFGFLTLPVGTIIRQLEKNLHKQTCVVGCLNNLYASFRNLSSSSFSTEQCILMLLHSRNAAEFECQNLKLKIDDSEPTKYFRCPRYRCCITSTTLSTYCNVICSCGYYTSISENVSIQNHGGFSNGIFTAENNSFIIAEGLCVMPTVNIRNFQVLRNLAKDADVTVEHMLDVGLKEIMLLLKLS